MNNDEAVLTFWQIYSYMCALKNVTSTTAAKEMDISLSVLNNWRNGGEPNKTTIQKVAEYFNVDSSFLSGTLTNIKYGSEDTKQFFKNNWQKYIAAAFPNAPKNIEVSDEPIFITKEDARVIEEYISLTRQSLNDIERRLKAAKEK